MPPGLLENQTAVYECDAAEFNTHRSSPYEASQSGESCLPESQVGVVRVTRAGGGQRSFGLFELEPEAGVPAQLGFAPYGQHVVLDSHLGAATEGEYALSLSATEIPQGLEVSGLQITIWGVPWAAVNDSRRGNCLNEADPAAGWAKCSLGQPRQRLPLRLPDPAERLRGDAGLQRDGELVGGRERSSAEALNRDSEGDPAPQEGCNTLVFEPRPLGFLTDTKASSASGYNFRLKVDYEGLLVPRLRAPAQTRAVQLTLPAGVTINPSVGSGPRRLHALQYASETDQWSASSGCPATSKIGDFRLHSPLYREWIDGGIYLAAAHQNPFGSLIAVYLVAKSPERGILVKVAGRIDPDPGTGSLSASFGALPQLPYTDLEVNFRSGQRAPLITPGFCGEAKSRIELTAATPGLFSPLIESTASQIETGIDRGPCPTGATPPFNPDAIAGGVNSNVNSYTPYFVHLIRKDTEQEITSYSLDLPKGIVGKLAGIPFCSDAQIAAARANGGVAETNAPSCPAASQVGRTLTGYGVGSGAHLRRRQYLHGRPLPRSAPVPGHDQPRHGRPLRPRHRGGPLCLQRGPALGAS